MRRNPQFRGINEGSGVSCDHPLSFNFVNPIVHRWAAMATLKAPRWEYALVVVGFRYTPESKKLRIFRSRSATKTALLRFEIRFHEIRLITPRIEVYESSYRRRD